MRRTLILLPTLLFIPLLGYPTAKPFHAEMADHKPIGVSGQIPLEDFFRNPEQGRFDVSPDGRLLSMMKPWKDRMNVFIRHLSDDRLPVGAPRQLTFVTDRDISGYSWKGNHTILYSRDFNGDENFHVFSVDVDTGKERDLTPFEKVRASVIDDLEEVSDTDVLIQMNRRNPELFDAYRLNVQSGELRMVARNPGKVESWGTDHTGEVRVAVESDGLLTKIYTRKS